MSRELKVLSAGWSIGVDNPLSVEINILSEDLKGRPVHHVQLTDTEALQLARQLLQSLEHIESLRRDR